MAFVDTAPQGVAQTTARVPSACTFWRKAEQGVFYASVEDHSECPIGMMTMGFTMPEASQRVQALVQTLADVQYFSPAEVSALPVVRKPHNGIVYGGLDQCRGIVVHPRYRAGYAGSRGRGMRMTTSTWLLFQSCPDAERMEGLTRRLSDKAEMQLLPGLMEVESWDCQFLRLECSRLHNIISAPCA